jgi:hypothetical protein
MKTYTLTKRAYVFDFDDVLVKTDARVKINLNTGDIKRYTSAEFANYSFSEGDEIDLTEFRDPKFIWSAKEYKMYDMLERVNKAVLEGRSSSEVFVLTAREPILRHAIHKYFTDKDISIFVLPLKNIITVGGVGVNTQEAKRAFLVSLLTAGYDVTFFDDDLKNIEAVETIDGIKTRHVQNDDI